MNKENGELLYHTSCIECSSSDAMAVYRKENEDGEPTVDAFCWSCHKYFAPDRVEEHGVKEPQVKSKRKEIQVDFSEIQELPKRG